MHAVTRILAAVVLAVALSGLAAVPGRAAPETTEQRITDSQSRYALGRMYEEAGDLAQAEEYYQQALELWPDNAEARLALQRLVDSRKPAEPQVIITKSMAQEIAAEIGVVFALLMLGLQSAGFLLVLLGALVLARLVQNQMLWPAAGLWLAALWPRLCPIYRTDSLQRLHSAAFCHLARTYDRLADPHEAARLYREALALWPENPRARSAVEGMAIQSQGAGVGQRLPLSFPFSSDDRRNLPGGP